MKKSALNQCGSWRVAPRRVAPALRRLALFWLLLVAALPLQAQSPGEGPVLPGVDDLQSRLEAWRAELAGEAEASGGEAPSGESEITAVEGPASPEAQRALDLLEEQLSRARRGAELEKAAEVAARELEAGPAQYLGTPPPFGFDVLDQALDRRGAEEQAERLANEAVDAALRELEDAERKAREQRAEADPWRERAASLRVELARQRLKNARLEQAAARSRHDLAQEVAAYVSEHLQATADALERAIERIEDRRLQAETRRQAIERDVELAEKRWHEAQARVERAPSAAARAEATARRAALDLEDARLRLLDEQLGRLRLEAEMWRHRFSAALEDQKVERPTLGLDEIESKLSREARERELQLAEYRAARRALVTDGESAELDTSLQRHRQTLTEGIDLFEDDLAEVERLLTRLERVRAEDDPAGLRLGEWLGAAWSSLVRAWHFNLAVVEGRPITLGKALLALLLILLGYRLSKQVARAFGDLMQRRINVGSGAAAALQNLIFYLLLVFFFLWAFQLVGIPLTVFTVLGGVVAIGVGFGSQNIVNNFISGLILLVERPIKVGDLIEVDGVLGSVERIGLRSTRVRAGDNTHVIVPNSSFLEKNVLNWTISDDVIRIEVDVGVAYGSPTEKVKELIEQALGEEPLVLNSRGWDVLFIEFGDNALLFRAHCWIRVAAYLDSVRAASALRFRIDKLFRQAGITIAFPQRDVHLDTLRPLEVKMVASSGGQAEGGKA